MLSYYIHVMVIRKLLDPAEVFLGDFVDRGAYSPLVLHMASMSCTAYHPIWQYWFHEFYIVLWGNTGEHPPKTNGLLDLIRQVLSYFGERVPTKTGIEQ